MSQERSEAIVLRGVDFSETSRIVTFLAPYRGRLTCMAKGVKRPKSQLAGLLDTFNLVEIVYYWKDSRSVQPLGEAALLHGFPGIKRDLEKGTYAAFPLELASRIVHENEPSEELYRELVEGLRALESSRANVVTHCCWQALRLLRAAGFEPSLDMCVRCGQQVGRQAGFDLEGGVVCLECPRDRHIDPEQLDVLKQLVNSARNCPDLPAGADLFALVRGYAARQVDTDFRSVRVIDQVFG